VRGGPEVSRTDHPLVALTIAGSDSAAGAGLQADLKTFAALGVFGTCAVTAVTAQSTVGVAGVEALDPAFVGLQIDTVQADLPVVAVKTGMLATSATVRLIGRRAADHQLPNLVVDPVLVSSTGHPLLDDGGLDAYRSDLLPYAAVATPNVREAALLLGLGLDRINAIKDVEGMASAAFRLAELGVKTVVVKGGHLTGSGSPDVVLHGGELIIVEAPRIVSTNDHGTGCTLSAAIAAWLAKGADPIESVRRAKSYVTDAMAGAARWSLGAGHGPLDHFGWGPFRR
jgi:hydroxymethylpyrimidine/phosphomethylpyrimidine kinase